ncbi:MOSC domain-containing protein [Shewanella surugensis]|uniref:MOSC domain-containing protein n=1 Tax=Shewanella surugensis TaxID=212020 RepID=A0ABT0LA21_9GAMM|nr:MOSC domain-containing protein [Shewanella surugensis]MCL1124404.1 MOSC domain-containing protein [Shewanella surugensis]
MEDKVLIQRLSGLYQGESIQSLSGVSTGMGHKIRVDSLEVQLDRIVGDEQADKRFHGGEDRVVHHYPREHYSYFRRMQLFNRVEDSPQMGENISSVGLDENQINIGDIIRIGSTILQVSQPRSPCFKVNLQFGSRELALAMQTSQRCGWLYRVITPGMILESDALVLQERISDISVAEAIKLYFAQEFNAQGYQQLATCTGLAHSWKKSVEKRLSTGVIENWQMRLYGS